MRRGAEHPITLATAAALAVACALGGAQVAQGADIPAAHVYHNHMPNFWPYYATSDAAVLAKYNALSTGASISYTSDGDVIALKLSPPSGYTYYLPSTVGSGAMPHDDLVSYYSANAKYACYQSGGWPMATAELQYATSRLGQVHTTFSGALATNVNNIELTAGSIGLSGLYTQGSSWNATWKSDYNNLLTTNGYRVLDLIHFTGHHSLGPLVGREYFEKDLIAHAATLAQSWFLGSSYRSSNGFFPTELSFSERLIPTLSKLGIKWSVLGNNHFSRTLTDYPYATYDATGDAADSPPNKAELRNTDPFSGGAWVSKNMYNNSTVSIVNKYPFASVPHNVRYVDPMTGAASAVAGIPVTINGSWEEGYLGSITVGEYSPYTTSAANAGRTQFFVIAHDGDNSSGRSGSYDTWQAGVTVTGVSPGVNLGVDEYLKAYPIPSTDVMHVQDGSWGDVLDSSANPMFYHWHLPPLIWASQFSAFNTAKGLSLAPKTNLKGVSEGATVSLEYGWHFQENIFAKLQAALNYAVTAEQIWLDNHTSHWSPGSTSATLDPQITYAGNQLNPWMIAAPVKGDASNGYAGGANPAELAWYFLLPAMDSGFGYYGENTDDEVKPALAFNNSLVFSKPYVTTNLAQDRTGPSVWLPQRYPSNPGSVNASKAEGWTTQWFSNKFAVYTYAFDASGMSTVNLMIRPHTGSSISNTDDTYKVYHPAALSGTSGLSITTANVGSWVAYPMTGRDLTAEMNGVSWIPTVQATMAVVPTTLTGNLYYAYLDQYRGQYLDYYVQATDALGNITSSDIQQVYVGYGTYAAGGNSGYTESASGTVAGTSPFLTGTVATATVAMPDFNPPSGVYSSAKSVQILSGTSGASVYYTTDGTTPTTSSTLYTGPVTVSASSLLRAIAVSGSVSSGASSSTYIITGTVSVPTTPTGVAAVPASSTSATVSWAGVSSATSYTVYRASSSSGTYASAGTTTSTSLTDSGLTAGGTYYYYVTASNSAGTSVASSVASVSLTAPAAPTGVSVATASSSSLTVSWTASSGATSYTVYRATSSAGTYTALGTSSTTSYTATGLTAGTSYYFYVTATNAVGTSAASAIVSAGTGYSSNYSAMYLRGSMNSWGATAMSLTANNLWSGSVSLTAGTTYTYKYEIGGGTTWSTNWGLASSSTTSLTSGTGSASGYNIYFTATTTGTHVFTFNDSTLAFTVTGPSSAPSAPTGVSVATVSSSSLTVSWTASSGATSYTVYRSTSASGTFSSVGTATSASFTDTGLTASTTYYYYVTATNSYGTSSASSTASGTTSATVTIPTAPSTVSVATVSSSSLTVTWTASSGATSYTVYRSTSSSGTFSSAGTSTSASFTDTGLAASTTYYYYVTATNSAGTSSASSTASGTTSAASTVTYTGSYSAMYLRGTMNSWGATTMSLIADHTWAGSATLTASTAYQFKFEIGGGSTWSTNWGKSSSSTTSATEGTAVKSGSYNLYFTPSTAGTYTFIFDDSTLSYWVVGSAASSSFTGTYSAMYLRGTMNTWGATAMSKWADHLWRTSVSLTAGTTYQYKYENRRRLHLVHELGQVLQLHHQRHGRHGGEVGRVQPVLHADRHRDLRLPVRRVHADVHHHRELAAPASSAAPPVRRRGRCSF
ncbi:MAG: fibronectin type III domain-containing protein [Anaeromyxobacter sp.]